MLIHQITCKCNSIITEVYNQVNHNFGYGVKTKYYNKLRLHINNLTHQIKHK